jgi:hypothetical protein
VDGVPTCTAQLPCDDYTLTVDVPAGSDVANYIKIQVNWPNQATLAQYDLFVFKLNPDNSLGSLVAANFFAVDPDVVTISAVSGKYLLRIAPTIAQSAGRVGHCPAFPALSGSGNLRQHRRRTVARRRPGDSAVPDGADDVSVEHLDTAR